MKKSIILTLAFLLGSNFAAASPEHNLSHPPLHQHEHNNLPRGFEQLNLTAEQKEKIQAIVLKDVNEHRDNINHHQEKNASKIDQHIQQERELLNNKIFNEAAARKMVEKQMQEYLANSSNEQSQHIEQRIKMLKKRHAIFQVLTPSQQKQFQEMQDKMHAEMDKHHPPMH